jgi:glucoside 3-dehydrogenase (cytochrome c) catalytic subunit
VGDLMADLSPKTNHFDAVVVGSGITGGWAAKELCERGLKTLVLERGRNIEHITDYKTALLNPWELPYNNRIAQADRAEAPIQSTLYLYDQSTKQHFVKDVEHPYVQEKPYHWYRGYHVGGRSLMWARHVFRYSDLDFAANLHEGVGVDWPIRYADLASWYEHVERFIGASGENSELPQLPAQILQPPFEMNAFEKHIRAHIEAAFDDRKLIASPTAVLTRELNGRGPCQGRNQCARGCPFSAYFSSNGVTLPAAAASGNLSLRADAIVHSLIQDESSGKASGVRVIDAHTKQTTEYFARVIFLCASTLNSTTILLNSRSRRFPEGYGNDSGALGHYLMDHHNGAGASGGYSGLADRYYRGRRPTSVYIPRYRNVKRRERDFTRGYGYEMYTSRESWSRGAGGPEFGAAFKNDITKPGDWNVYMEGYGECLPYRENRMWLDHDALDRWGMPSLHVEAGYGENERKMALQMAADALEILNSAKLDWVSGFNNPVTPGQVIHEMGTARMGRDPATSVLNGHNQVHAAPNVFVTDGSCMVSSPPQNPSLTYMALTARAANYAADLLKAGTL